MPFSDFLQLVKTVKILYGREFAISLFQKNYRKYYNLNEIGIDAFPAFEDLPLQLRDPRVK